MLFRSNPGLPKQIEQKKQLDDALKVEMSKLLGEFKDKFKADRKAAATA